MCVAYVRKNQGLKFKKGERKEQMREREREREKLTELRKMFYVVILDNQ